MLPVLAEPANPVPAPKRGAEGLSYGESVFDPDPPRDEPWLIDAISSISRFCLSV